MGREARYASDYLASARSFKILLNQPAAEPSVLNPVTPPAPAVNIVEQAPVARNILLVVSLMRADEGLVTVPPGSSIPYVLYGFDEDAVGGGVSASALGNFGGVGRGLSKTHLAAPYVPVFFTLAPGRRVYAVARGRLPAAATDPAAVVIGVTITESIEPSADGQTERLLGGIKAALTETIQSGVLAAARTLGVVKKG